MPSRDELIGRVKELLGTLLHKSLRQNGDSEAERALWEGIAKLPADDWSGHLDSPARATIDLVLEESAEIVEAVDRDEGRLEIASRIRALKGASHEQG